ncbi:tol-pal system YbgF family protein [Schlesneria sp. T3-172]|uniref:tetratricopeptide repeat protein n=1 Tax=Schlesneria sphaerica TaxID=3373610 RepID=UPI0037C76048
MKCRLRICALWFVLLAVFSPRLTAEEPYLEFLQGLRNRNYFDYALLYLDQLAQRPSVPAEIQKLIPYEKAITLREYAKTLRSPEKQFEQLDQALAYLDQFIRENPDHPSSGDANAERAQMLLQKAGVEIFQSKAPSNQGSKSEFQRRGRELVQKARDVLKLAFDQHDAAFKKFPTYIDAQKEPAQYAERSRIERNLILETLSLAKCTYLEAQTYDPTAPEFKQLLSQAADEFEKMHQRHRSQIGGLHARAWQGKAFEEQGDLQKALGIYNELLDHPGDDGPLQSLKAQVLQFKLICLHLRNDYQLVVDLAEEWLKKSGDDAKTPVGLGIQWEQARAYEALGNNRNLPKADQERFWRQARTVAQQINKYPGEYKDVSLSMMQRTQVNLGGRERKPDDFETAYGLGRQNFNSSQEIKKELDAAIKNQKPAEEVTRLRQDWTNELNDAAQNFDLAMRLMNKRDNVKDVATARLLLAYTNFYLRRNYEAAVLAQFVARTTSDEEGSVALDAAYMAMAAFVQAYNDNKAEPDSKQDEMRMIIKAANLIAQRWPESDKANEARLILGRMYSSAKKPVDAAEWFSKVPESDPKYPEAQLAAGQAYWIAYGSASRMAPEERPTPEKQAEWKASAEQFLRTGIQKLTATLPKEGSLPQELVSAKIYLAEILLSQGKEAESIALLQDDPQSIVKAITVTDESQRPEKGIQSRSVAKSVYTLLLRAYIGLGPDRIDDARAAMRTLEAIAAGDPSSDLTDLYVGLGRMLKTELERFQSNGETERFNKLMEAFETFLDDMYKKQEGQTLGSLSWIGETYFALGEISTDGSKTASYYDRAASAFNGILTRAASDPGFATPDQLLNVKVRLVRCNRLKKDFAGAQQLLGDILKVRGNDLRTQVEGASVYQDWGSSGDKSKFAIAINGEPNLGVWGWGGIARRIQQQKNFADRPDLVDHFLDARYAVSLCRFRYGMELAPKEKQKALDACAMELVGTSSIMKVLPEEKRAKLNELYREVLKESGQPVVDLPRNEEIPLETSRPTKSAEAASEPNKEADATAATGQGTAGTAEASKSIDTTTWVIFLGCVVAGIGLIGWVLFSGKGKAKKPKSFGRKDVPVSFSGVSVDSGPPAAFAAPAPGKVRPRNPVPKGTATAPGAAPTAQAPAKGTTRTQSRTESGAPPSPKPRPRPTEPRKDE